MPEPEDPPSLLIQGLCECCGCECTLALSDVTLSYYPDIVDGVEKLLVEVLGFYALSNLKSDCCPAGVRVYFSLFLQWAGGTLPGGTRVVEWDSTLENVDGTPNSFSRVEYLDDPLAVISHWSLSVWVACPGGAPICWDSYSG